MRQAVRLYRSYFVAGRFTPWFMAVVVLAMRAGMFLSRGVVSVEYADTGYVWHYLAPYFSTPWIDFAASAIVVFVIAFMLGELDRDFIIIRSRTSMPFVMALVFFSVHPFFLNFAPDFIALLCVMAAFFPLLKSYQESFPEKNAFKIGVLLGLAGIFQIYSLLLIPAFWIAESSMRGFRVRAFLSSLFGISIVFWGVFSAYFFFDKLEMFFLPFHYFAALSLPSVPVFSTQQWILVAGTSLSILIFIILDYPFFSRGRVLAKKTIDFLILIIVWSTLLQCVYWENTMFFSYVVNAMFAFIVAQYFSYTTSPKAVVGFFVLVALVFGVYFVNYTDFFFPYQ